MDHNLFVAVFGGGGRGGSPVVSLDIAYTATQFTFKFKLPATSDIKIYWGDGTSESVTGQDSTLITKTSNYSGAATYKFTLGGDVTDLTYIDIQNQTFVSGDISSFSALTNLTALYFRTTSVSGDISGFSALTSLTILRGYSSSVTGDISGFSALTSIIDMAMQSTSVSGDVSGFSVLTSATNLRLDSTSVDFDSAPAWSNASATIYLHNCAMTSTQVNNMIESFSTCTSCTINVAGTNAHRTAASNDDLNTLLANGNTITLNDTLSAEKITDGDMSADTNWDVTAASWSIAAGVAAYDDANDGQGIFQADGDMVSGVAVDTVYKLDFTTASGPSASVKITNAANDTDYFAQASYSDGTHTIYFTSPSAVSGGGIGWVAYQAGDAFTLDDVSLKTVTFV